jgi:hypothetical protein
MRLRSAYQATPQARASTESRIQSCVEKISVRYTTQQCDDVFIPELNSGDRPCKASGQRVLQVWLPFNVLMPWRV